LFQTEHKEERTLSIAPQIVNCPLGDDIELDVDLVEIYIYLITKRKKKKVVQLKN